MCLYKSTDFCIILGKIKSSEATLGYYFHGGGGGWWTTNSVGNVQEGSFMGKVRLGR